MADATDHSGTSGPPGEPPRRRRRSIAIAAIVGGVAAVASLIPIFRPTPLFRGPEETPEADVAVATFEVGTATRGSDVTFGTEADAPVESGEAEVSAVRIGLRNRGDAPAYLTRAVLTFRAHEVLETCVEIGDAILVTDSVDVQVPYEVDEVPWTQEEEINFRVAPNDVDRIELTFSIPDLPPFPAPAAVSVDVALQDDSGGEPIPAGTARLLLPLPNVTKALEELTENPYDGAFGDVRPDRECPEGNLERMRAVLEAPALPESGSTPHFDDLLEALEDYDAGQYYVWPES